MEVALQYFVLLSMASLSHAGCGPRKYDLVTGLFGVSDSAISASSTHYMCALGMMRFSESGSWCSLYYGVGHYLQVEFKSVSLLQAIQTKGRGDFDQWLTSFSVNISMDGLTWTSLMNSTGDVQVFPGNSDRNTIVTNDLDETVIAKYIRVISVSVYERASMRLEVHGCPYSLTNGTCHQWGARRGFSGDALPMLEHTEASNQGLCGLKCCRQPECGGFLFDVTIAHCRLLKGTLDGSQNTVNLDGVWYFVKV